MELENALGFLSNLNRNNNRDWFNDNKQLYEAAHKQFSEFTGMLLQMIYSFDTEIGLQKPVDCLFRIYRDVRFSKNKLPYKTNFGAYIAKGGRKGRYAGYYFHLEPGASFVGGGIYRPLPEVLKMVRNEIYYHFNEFSLIISASQFKEIFGKVEGERLSLPPKGFPGDFVGIEYLKYKDYFVSCKLDDNLLTSPRLMMELEKIYKAVKPLNTFLNNAITTGV